MGQSVPVLNRTVTQTPIGPQISETVDYRDADSGFSVRPRLSGEEVTLEIASRRWP